MNLKRILPIIGIIAFSLCSVWSLYHLFEINATHQTLLYWIPAVLVELITAWSVYQLVEQIRTLTRSNLSKQDRRFYRIVGLAFFVVALPTLSVSVWANWVEFGNPLLGLLFPVGSVGCAIGAALPDTVSRFEKAKQQEKQETRALRKRREAERKAAEAQRKEAERKAKDRERVLKRLGTARATLEQLIENPEQGTVEIAQALGITRQSVGNHLTKLEKAGAIQRNGNGVWEVIFDA